MTMAKAHAPAPAPLRAAAFRARALLLGARLDLRNWPEAETLARAPLTTRLPGGGLAVLFRYGVAVLLRRVARGRARAARAPGAAH